MHTEQDLLHRFFFKQADVRGEMVRLHDSYQAVIATQAYPLAIKQLLGEMLCATALLSATLKFEGEIALQVQSEGALKYAVIHGNHQQKVRGIARWDENLDQLPDTFSALLPKGTLIITITPTQGERYQGMVALDKPSLAACLEDYFLQSEQLATKLILSSVHTQKHVACAGLLLQVLPKSSEVVEMSQREDFSHLTHLAETLTDKELFDLSAHELLYRLFHQEQVTMLDPQTVTFSCTCSRERSAAAIGSIDKAELLGIIATEGEIKMNCQYCHAEYCFDAVDVEALHAGSAPAPSVTQ